MAVGAPAGKQGAQQDDSPSTPSVGMATPTERKPTTTPSEVTLEEAISEALSHNLDLIAQRFAIPIADARILTAGLRPNPVASMSGDHLDVLGTGYSAENSAGPNEFAYRTDLLLERGGKRESRTALAKAEKSVAELELLDAVRNLVFGVQSAYVDVLLAKENLTLARENLKALEGIVAVNENRVRAGETAPVELTRSQVAAMQFQNAVKQAELRLAQARNTIQLLMGREAIDSHFDVSGEMRSDAELAEPTELREAALAERPDLQALRESKVRSAADLRLQIAQGKVDYTVGTEYRRQQGINGTGNSLGFFFSAPLPLFNRNQGEIARARLEQERANARIQALEAQVATEVANAYQQYVTARSLLGGIQAAMLGKAREVRTTTEYSYRRGEASLIEFLDAQRAFNETMASYNDARAGYAKSLYQIDFALGRKVQP